MSKPIKRIRRPKATFQSFARLRSLSGSGICYKKKKEQTQTNSYQYLTPPSTPATTQLQSMVQSPTQIDPSIPYSYGREREDYQNTFQNPLGAYTSPAVRDAAQRVMGERLSEGESAAEQSSRLASQGQAFGQQATVAGLTAPQLVQSGAISVTREPFDWLGAIGTGASVGAAAL